MPEETAFKVSKVEYRVSLKGETASIVTAVETEAETNLSLVASLKVDNIELLPSERIALNKGSNSHLLKPVKIIRPLKSPYVFELSLRKSENEICFCETQEITIAGQD